MVRLRYPPKRHYPDQWSGCDLGLLLMGYAGTFTVATAYAKLAGVYAKVEILSNAARRLRSPSRYSGGAWGRGCSDAYWLSGPVSRILCPIGRGFVPPDRRQPSIYGDGCPPPPAAYPGQRRAAAVRRAETRAPAPCLALLPMGFAWPAQSPGPPVVSCTTLSLLLSPSYCLGQRPALCCTCRRVASPGRYPASCSTEFGLSSWRGRNLAPRLPSPLI